MEQETARHYDLLIEEGNDPVRDPPALQAYMERWDGVSFLEDLELSPEKDVLEIGVGTGRLARRVCGGCRNFTGIDLSEKTIGRAAENLKAFSNITLLCGNFLTFPLAETFHVIYSSLTLLHIRDKARAVCRIARLLRPGGRAVLSLDKSRSGFLDYGSRRIRVYPDDPDEMEYEMERAGLWVVKRYENDFAHIMVAEKRQTAEETAAVKIEKGEKPICPDFF